MARRGPQCSECPAAKAGKQVTFLYITVLHSMLVGADDSPLIGRNHGHCVILSGPLLLTLPATK